MRTVKLGYQLSPDLLEEGLKYLRRKGGYTSESSRAIATHDLGDVVSEIGDGRETLPSCWTHVE